MSRTNRQAIVETAAMRHARQAKTILRRLEKTIVGAAPEPAVIDTVNAASGEELLGGHQAHARLTRSEVEKGAHHVLECCVEFPVVRGKAEVPSEPLRLLEMLPQRVDGR